MCVTLSVYIIIFSSQRTYLEENFLRFFSVAIECSPSCCCYWFSISCPAVVCVYIFREIKCLCGLPNEGMHNLLQQCALYRRQCENYILYTKFNFHKSLFVFSQLLLLFYFLPEPLIVRPSSYALHGLEYACCL